MSEAELLQLRRAKWRLNGRPVRTLDDAREFIDSVGFCLMYPARQPVLLPTFLGAWAGSDENLPDKQHAFADARAAAATELMVRLLREKAAFEANLFGENVFLLSSAIFPFYYRLVGDSNPKHPPRARSPLARATFKVIHNQGPINKSALRDALGDEPSEAALDRALGELWSRLRILRVDYKPAAGAYWQELYRWATKVVEEGLHGTMLGALSALISSYVDCLVAAEREEINEFFSRFVSRAKVREALNALLTQREANLLLIGNRMRVRMKEFLI